MGRCFQTLFYSYFHEHQPLLRGIHTRHLGNIFCKDIWPMYTMEMQKYNHYGHNWNTHCIARRDRNVCYILICVAQVELVELRKHRAIWCNMPMSMCILYIRGLDMFHKALVIRNQSIKLSLPKVYIHHEVWVLGCFIWLCTWLTYHLCHYWTMYRTVVYYMAYIDNKKL